MQDIYAEQAAIKLFQIRCGTLNNTVPPNLPSLRAIQIYGIVHLHQPPSQYIVQKLWIGRVEGWAEYTLSTQERLIGSLIMEEEPTGP